MKLSRSLIAGALLLVLLLPSWSPISLQALNSGALPSALEYHLLVNPGMEAFDPAYDQFQGVSCQVATGWQRFSYAGPDPCLMDTRVFASGGWVERIEGDTSQMIVSAEPYTAGIWQDVTGLTPGEGYGFHAAMLTIYQTSAPPAFDGTMIKQVGIDPTGGTNPQGQTVIWSEPDDHDEGPWDIDQRVAAYAQGTTATVFVRVISPHEAGPSPYLNLSFLDSAILARTTPVATSSPAESESLSFVVQWSHGQPAPGVVRVKWYDIQWMDEEEGVWHDWLTEVKVQDGKVQETFVGQRGHTYRFRARVWQKYENGAHLYSPYRSSGDTQTYVKGPELTGRVLTSAGIPASGATVAIAGTSYSAVSGSDGYYRIKLLPLSGVHAVTVSHPYWRPPAPVYGVTFGPSETVILDWSLRPRDDAVENGGFELGLTAWSPITDGGGVPQVVVNPVHTGSGALGLGGSAAVAFTNGVSQALTLTHSWNPALSLWYRPETADAAGDRLNVVISVLTDTFSSGLVLRTDTGAGPELDGGLTPRLDTTYVFTPSLGTTGWQHLSLRIGPEGYLTGTVTVRLQVWNDGDGVDTTVYLDEVSLGRTPGGPLKMFLPLILGKH